MKEAFDVLVIGSGPAGIAAAVTAAQTGRRVGLVDDNPAPGGQVWRSGAHLPAAARQWIARLRESGVVRLQGWRAFDAPQPRLLRAERSAEPNPAAPADDLCAELSCEKLILATGARERFLPFPGWTLPNVMGAGGMDAMVRGGMPVAGKRIVVAGTGPLLLAVAAHLRQEGAVVAAICEQASTAQMLPLALQAARQPAKLRQGIGYRWTTRASPFLTGCHVTAAHGKDRLQSVTLRRRGRQWIEECDFLACGFHLVPNTELAARLGCRIENGFVTVDETMQTSIPDVYCAGEPTGIGGVELSLIEGRIAALACCGRLGEARGLIRQRQKASGFVRALRNACALRPELRAVVTDETIVCRCEDVRAGTLRSRTSWRDAKLHTRCGMGPCQGRVCGAAVEFLFGWTADSSRPPVFPARVSSIAGPAATLTPKSDNSTEAP